MDNTEYWSVSDIAGFANKNHFMYAYPDEAKIWADPMTTRDFIGTTATVTVLAFPYTITEGKIRPVAPPRKMRYVGELESVLYDDGNKSGLLVFKGGAIVYIDNSIFQ